MFANKYDYEYIGYTYYKYDKDKNDF